MNELIIKKATFDDFRIIQFYLKKFGLDDVNIEFEQFTAATIKNTMIGFGRIKPYTKLYELSSVGVLENYRSRGIGEKLINSIIEIFPSNDIWITTKIPAYFKRFGFCICHTPPLDIQNKQKYLCSKLQSNLNNTHCMLLKKIRKNEVQIPVTGTNLSL